MKKSLYSSGRTGNPVNRDSINTKIFEEGEVGFGEGRRNPFFRRVPPPQSLSIFPVTPYGSMKLKGPA